jgi:hypothetical protein
LLASILARSPQAWSNACPGIGSGGEACRATIDFCSSSHNDC